MTSNIQSECFISAKHCYSMLKFVYHISSWSPQFESPVIVDFMHIVDFNAHKRKTIRFKRGHRERPILKPQIHDYRGHIFSWTRSAMETIRTAVMDMGEPRQLVLPCPYCGDNKVIMARQVKKEEVESNPIFADFLDYSANGTSPPTRPRCSRYRRCS